VPGLGNLLSLVRRYARPQRARVPPVQDFVSYCRLVQGAPASASKRRGTSGKKSGNAPRTWAFAEAAALCLRHNEPGQKSRARVEQKPDKGQARTLLAHT
jgi:Transposase IS116/IS110/IS902 family